MPNVNESKTSASFRNGTMPLESESSQEQTEDAWEQPLLLTPRRGRPSNWAKKLAVQQSVDRERELQSKANKPSSTKPPVSDANTTPLPVPLTATKATPSSVPAAVSKPCSSGLVQDTPQPAGPKPASNVRVINSRTATPETSSSTPKPAARSPISTSPATEDTDVTESDIFEFFDSPAESVRTPETNGNGTNLMGLQVEISAVADEVRKWEAITQQVATDTKEMTKLIRDLAATPPASKSPPRSDAFSHEDQAKFREQLLKAAQLNLKADIVQTINQRDADTREQQVYCVLVLAGAVVIAAFLLSPFAGWVVDCLYWLTTRSSLL